jgi:hypothetical protein
MRTSAAWIFNVASDRTNDCEETSPDAENRPFLSRCRDPTRTPRHSQLPRPVLVEAQHLRLARSRCDRRPAVHRGAQSADGRGTLSYRLPGLLPRARRGRGGQLLHARQAVTQAAQYGSSRGLLWLAVARDCPASPIHLGHRVPADLADLSRSQSTRKPAAEHFQPAAVRSPPLWL